MALSKLNDALVTLRSCSAAICFMAILFYLGKDYATLDTMTRCSLLVLMIQLIVTCVEILVSFRLGVEEPLPDHLEWSLGIVMLDYVVAMLVMCVGLGGIGVFISKTNAHMCHRLCKVSLVYNIFVLLGGGLNGLAAVCNSTIAAKMNILRQAID